jgi:hypothetical protein
MRSSTVNVVKRGVTALAFIALALTALSGVSSARIKGRTFPFTKEEDADGARYVWFMYEQAGFPYDYMPASSLRGSPHFRPAPGNRPQVGDVAWWNDYVAMYDPSVRGRELWTAPGRRSLKALERKYGPVLWLRFWCDGPCREDSTVEAPFR